MKGAGVAPNIFVFNAAIAACSDAAKARRASPAAQKGAAREALALVAEMRETADVDGPDIYSYNAAISACEKGKQWESALELLGAMGAAGCAPTEMT